MNRLVITRDNKHGKVEPFSDVNLIDYHMPYANVEAIVEKKVSFQSITYFIKDKTSNEVFFQLAFNDRNGQYMVYESRLAHVELRFELEFTR